MERNMPEKGEEYRFFNGKECHIIAIARHAETLEELVVYEETEDEQKVYAEPLPAFMRKVDREKYPDAVQEYRFEKIGDTGNKVAGSDARISMQEKRHRLLMEFLELDSNEEKLAFLQKKRSELDEHILEAISQSLDFVENSGDIDLRILEIEKYLRMLARYEVRRER